MTPPPRPTLNQARQAATNAAAAIRRADTAINKARQLSAALTLAACVRSNNRGTYYETDRRNGKIAAMQAAGAKARAAMTEAATIASTAQAVIFAAPVCLWAKATIEKCVISTTAAAESTKKAADLSHDIADLLADGATGHSIFRTARTNQHAWQNITLPPILPGDSMFDRRLNRKASSLACILTSLTLTTSLPPTHNRKPTP